jgi:hypothetical protein
VAQEIKEKKAFVLEKKTSSLNDVLHICLPTPIAAVPLLYLKKKKVSASSKKKKDKYYKQYFITKPVHIRRTKTSIFQRHDGYFDT